VYLTAPFVGAVAAALLYRWLRRVDLTSDSSPGRRGETEKRTGRGGTV